MSREDDARLVCQGLLDIATAGNLPSFIAASLLTPAQRFLDSVTLNQEELKLLRRLIGDGWEYLDLDEGEKALAKKLGLG